jgi:hypothetical protein
MREKLRPDELLGLYVFVYVCTLLLLRLKFLPFLRRGYFFQYPPPELTNYNKTLQIKLHFSDQRESQQQVREENKCTMYIIRIRSNLNPKP